MSARALLLTASLAVIAATVAPAARGQTPVGSVAALTGTVEVQRGARGEWQAVAIGSPVFASDAMRSGAAAAAKLIFVDDAVLNLGPSTALSVEHFVSGKAARRSLVHLTQGKIEVLVSGYGGENARYEVETATAVARVQGTDFIVRYDAAAQATDVVGIDGTVAVQGLTGIIGPGVAVGPHEMTRVPRDGFPSPAKAVDAAEAREFAEGLQLIGTGTREGLDTDNPILDGRVVGATDRPVTGAAGGAATAGTSLRPGVPGQTLIDTLSPDIRANTQPLPVYRAVAPNQVPVPPH